MTTFISYSRDNSDFAVRLARDLRAAGFDIWLDQLDIRTGARWDDEVEKALVNSTTFLIVLTPESIQSQNVKDEIGYAIDGGKHILPIILKPCNVPFRLRRFQYVDFSNKPYDASLSEIKSLLSNTSELATAQDMGAEHKDSGTRPSTKMRVAEEKSQPQFSQPPVQKSESEKSRSLINPILVLLGVVGLIAVFLIISNPPAPAPTEVPAATEPDFSPPENESTIATEPPIAPPETFLVTNDYEISVCCNSVDQRSDVIDYAISVYTVSALGMEFRSTDPNACSDIFLHILLDGEEIYTTDAVGPVSGNDTTYWVDLSFAAYEGEHTLTLSPEGILGGCNTGTLGGWGGTLTVQTDQY
jgi:hypothetical protein